MKSKVFVLMLALFACLSGTAFADSPPATPTSSVSQALSPDDIAKLRATLDAISKNMGNEAPSNSAAPPAPATSSSAATPEPAKKSTVADVANKALDMMGSAVAAVSSNLQKIAPHVWRIMIKQQYAKAAYEVAMPACLFFGGLIFVVVMRTLWKPVLTLKDEKEDMRYKNSTDWNNSDTEKVKYAFRSVVPAVYLVIIGIWLGCSIGTSVKYVINPEYYAVKDILTLVTNPSQAPD